MNIIGFPRLILFPCKPHSLIWIPPSSSSSVRRKASRISNPRKTIGRVFPYRKIRGLLSMKEESISPSSRKELRLASIESLKVVSRHPLSHGHPLVNTIFPYRSEEHTSELQ